MKIPPGKMDRRRFNDWLMKERARLFRLDGDYLVCRTCGTEVALVPCYVSLHLTESKTCVGFGDVKVIHLVFCPKCEVVPTETVRSCVHDQGRLDHRTGFGVGNAIHRLRKAFGL